MIVDFWGEVAVCFGSELGVVLVGVDVGRMVRVRCELFCFDYCRSFRGC